MSIKERPLRSNGGLLLCTWHTDTRNFGEHHFSEEKSRTVPEKKGVPFGNRWEKDNRGCSTLGAARCPRCCCRGIPQPPLDSEKTADLFRRIFSFFLSDACQGDRWASVGKIFKKWLPRIFPKEPVSGFIFRLLGRKVLHVP